MHQHLLRTFAVTLLLVTLMLATASVVQAEAVPTRLPAGFVRLGEIAPHILEDMRYATPRNFTGNPVPGYRSGRCILARPAAEALARVNAAVAEYGYALKVYDCYRPARAVRSFVRWAKSQQADQATKFYYPRIPRSEIISRGYVAEHSSHSRGIAVDLTLVRIDGVAAQQSTAPDKKNAESDGPPQASCLDTCRETTTTETTTTGARTGLPAPTLPASVDMGTAWDCFDIKSHTQSSTIGPAARENRALLVRAMTAQGFRNYHREWWHFSWPARGFQQAHDFIVD